jgi:hypothetical protein
LPYNNICRNDNNICRNDNNICRNNNNICRNNNNICRNNNNICRRNNPLSLDNRGFHFLQKLKRLKSIKRKKDSTYGKCCFFTRVNFFVLINETKYG